MILFTVEAWDVNCSQHITERFTTPEVAEAVSGLRERLAKLEAENAELRAALDADPTIIGRKIWSGRTIVPDGRGQAAPRNKCQAPGARGGFFQRAMRVPATLNICNPAHAQDSIVVHKWTSHARERVERWNRRTCVCVKPRST